MSDLDDSLKYLSNLRRTENGFGDPFDDSNKPKKDIVLYTKSKKKKKSLTQKFKETEDRLSKGLDDYDLSFDVFFDEEEFDEDLEFKDRLIGMGRKYAREHALDEDTSEINKAFAPQEKALTELLVEIESDKKKIDDDITKIRSNNYGANKKALADLVSAKNTMHSTALSVIKEKNSINKTKFELKQKLGNANGKNGENSDDLGLQASSILQQVLGAAGQDSLLASVGGREGSSGAIMSESELYDDSMDIEDSIIRQRYGINDDEETDGDKFLKYEGTHVNLILHVNKYDGSKTITAEDDSGNTLDDYPIPTDIENIRFDIDPQTSIATDNLNREYIVRDYE